LIEGQVVERRKHAHVRGIDTMQQATAAPTHRAVARAHMIEIEIGLEPYAPTVARTRIRLLQSVLRSVMPNDSTLASLRRAIARYSARLTKSCQPYGTQSSWRLAAGHSVG
jgi:hypothetical protein